MRVNYEIWFQPVLGRLALYNMGYKLFNWDIECVCLLEVKWGFTRETTSVVTL